MAETYCGKTCTECEYKETLSCAGCKVGPGRITGGDCRISKCCREKGHPECSTCGFHETCAKLRGKDHMPEYRLKAIEAEKTIAAQIAQRAPVLGRWISILFWLIIPNIVAALLTNETVVGWFPFLYIPGRALEAICAFVYGIVLLRLTSQEDRYRTAGICMLVGGLVSVLMCFPTFFGDIWWRLILSLVMIVVNPIGIHYEFTAHSVVLNTLDNKLADKWTTLSKWYIVSYCVVIGGALLPALIPFVGILVVLVADIALVVMSVLELVYLYITAKRFKAYKIETN